VPRTGRKSTPERLSRLLADYAAAAKAAEPWFTANMPEYYFRTHGPEEQLRHLQAIVSSRLSGEQSVVLKGLGGSALTYITPGQWIKELLSVLESFGEAPLSTARIVLSADGTLRLSDFLLAPQPRADTKDKGFARALAALRRQDLTAAERREARAFLAAASRDYVDKFEAARAARHLAGFLRVRGGEAAEVTLAREVRPGEHRVMVVIPEPPARNLLAQAYRALARRALAVDRAYLDLFPGGERPFAVMSFYLLAGKSEGLEAPGAWEELAAELAMLKWRPPHEFDRLIADRGWPARRVELLRAAAAFAHQFLARENRYLYTVESVVRAVFAHPDCAARVLDFFEARFAPEAAERALSVERALRAAEAAVAEVSGPWREIFSGMQAFAAACLRTNYFLAGRSGLAFRLDPAALRLGLAGEAPYGLYFFSGPDCLGFHLRYREMSRGGLRLVPTRSSARFEVELGRLFDEAVDLARTQQEKNKDIPEGGAKGVILLGPRADPDLALKSCVDSLLDCIVPGESRGASGPTLPGVVDYLGRREVIYLGPDEHITPARIEWIVARAEARGYPFPATFMSSKPRLGINHKQYGVTSLGVVVYLEEALHYLGLDPAREAFSVKFTGGPRGDVAGNAMSILMRRYPDTARILAATDSQGAAYDPAGLDHAELARLIDGQLSIAAFEPARLRGAGAFVASADSPAGARQRDELHNLARADVFIPAGGRPETVNERNWQAFLDADGRPTARIIVEAANIFFSEKARENLEDAGALIVRDMSANKTGVICSSYEVLAGLVLSPEEFWAVKRTYVRQVLDILTVRARDEARLLLREHRKAGGKRRLSQLSAAVAHEINRLADAVVAWLSGGEVDPAQDPLLTALVLAYCPKILAKRWAERILTRVPRGHIIQLLAHAVASRMIYAEGLGWLNRLTAVRDVREVVGAYLGEERRLRELCARLAASNLPERRELSRILTEAGLKLLTMERLGLA
jgi:glutamate dehydrogenase